MRQGCGLDPWSGHVQESGGSWWLTNNTDVFVVIQVEVLSVFFDSLPHCTLQNPRYTYTHLISVKCYKFCQQNVSSFPSNPTHLSQMNLLKHSLNLVSLFKNSSGKPPACWIKCCVDSLAQLQVPSEWLPPLSSPISCSLGHASC